MVADAGLLNLNLTFVVQIVIFLITVFLLWKLAWKRIVKVLDARADKIETGLRAAEESQKKLAEAHVAAAQLLDESRQQGRELLMRVHQEVSAEGDELRERARADAEAIAQKARDDIAAERDRAIREMRAEVGILVIEAAQRVLGSAIDAQTHNRLLDESLKELQPGGAN